MVGALKCSKTVPILTTCSFQQVPTFGCDTIRRFGGSVSSTKKMTARGFEDIIQVSPFASATTRGGPECLCSVGYPFLRGYSQSHTTRLSSISPLTSPHGTHMQSFRNIQSAPFDHFDHKQKNLGNNFAALLTIHIHSHWGQGVVYLVGTLQIHHKEMDKVPTTNQPGTLQTHSEFSKPISLQCTQYGKCLVHSQCPRSCDCDVLIR